MQVFKKNKMHMDELSLIYYLQATVQGIESFVSESYVFFTEDEPILDIPDIWLPYNGQNQRLIPLSGIFDQELNQLFQDFSREYDQFFKIIKAWTKSLLLYLGRGEPKRPEEWVQFRKAIDKHRKSNGASWMRESFSQKYALEMQKLIAEISYLARLINQKMADVYQDKLVVFDDLGDQRAKDLIDEAEGETDLRKAIDLLNEAIEFGDSGIQASKAFIGLGMRHEDLGEIEQAINAYSKALTAWKPFALIYFWRGRLYFLIRRWEQANKDFKQALAFQNEEGLPQPERKEAENYLAEIEKGSNN